MDHFLIVDALELLERGEMKMESIGGASTESEDEGETGEEEPMECPSPLTRVSPPEPSPPLEETAKSSNTNGVANGSNSKEQLNIGVSIVSRLAPPITGRRPSVPPGSSPKTAVSSTGTTTSTSATSAAPQKVYYSLPKFQTSGNELIIIGDARLESV